MKIKLSNLLGALIITASTACRSGDACGNDVGSNIEIEAEPADVAAHDDSAMVEFYLISDSCAGPFNLDAPIPDEVEGFEMTESVEDRVLSDGKLINIPVYRYEIGNEGWVRITPQYDLTTGGDMADRVGGIFVYSDLFLTDRGIGAMSSIEEFAASYPDFKIRYAEDENLFIVETPQLRNVQFLMEGECFAGEDQTPSSGVLDGLDVADFKENSCFIAIRIGR